MALGALYGVQYLPLVFFIVVLPIILRDNGLSVASIAMVQIAFLPYVIKFLWAPLLDRYSLGSARYKNWIIVLSLIHVVFLGLLMLIDPAAQPTLLFVLLLCATLAISTQDIAVDALAIRILAPDQRGLGNGLQSGGGYLGGAIGAGAFLSIYQYAGWTWTVLAQSFVFVLPLLLIRLIQEPPPYTSGTDRPSFRQSFKFFKQPRIGRWSIFLVTFRLPLMATILPLQISMVDNGMSPSEIGVWLGLIALSTAMIMSFFSGFLVSIWQRRTAFLTFASINVVMLVLLYGLVSIAPEKSHYGLILIWGAAGLSDVVLFAGAMDRARPAMPGFDFSIQVGLIFFIQTLAEPLWGQIVDTSGLLPMLGIAVALSTVPLLVLLLVKLPLGPSLGNRHTSTASFSSK